MIVSDGLVGIFRTAEMAPTSALTLAGSIGTNSHIRCVWASVTIFAKTNNDTPAHSIDNDCIRWIGGNFPNCRNGANIRVDSGREHRYKLTYQVRMGLSDNFRENQQRHPCA